MGATEEQMKLVAASGMDAVAYVLILYSLAFLTFLFVNMLIGLYDRLAGPVSVAGTADSSSRSRGINGHAAPSEGRQLRDAEEFELDGLMSDDEDEEQAARRKLLNEDRVDDGPESPSTLGRNSDRVVS
jgi:hypothetical protein